MPENLSHLLSRRGLLQVGFLGGIGLSLADYLRLAEASEQKPKADACIFVHLKGGPSHLDSLDMKPEAPVEERGEFARIDTVVPGYQVCEHLPQLAKYIDRFTLVRGISHSAGAHPQANEYLFTGNRPTPAVVYPCLGSVATKELTAPPAIPPFVAIPNSDMSPGFLGVSYAAFKTTAAPTADKPFEVRGLSLPPGDTPQSVQARNELLRDLNRPFVAAAGHSSLVEGLDRFGQKASDMILSDRARKAFDVGQESPAILKLFESDTASQTLLLASRLVEHGVRFVTVTNDGWDTHLDNFTGHKRLLPPFDASITSLVLALEAKGLLDRVLVVATGEFGRTPTINKNAGRDHWPRTMWTLVAGGGVKRNHFVGGTDSKGHAPNDDTQLKPDDLAASIYHALGIDPQLEYSTRTGRPVRLVPEGQVIRDLFA